MTEHKKACTEACSLLNSKLRNAVTESKVSNGIGKSKITEFVGPSKMGIKIGECDLKRVTELSKN